jgi:protein gp37
MAVATRFSGPGQPYEGLAKQVNGKPAWTGEVRFIKEHLDDPLKWKKPRMIFVNSMSDLFHESVPDAWLHEIFHVMALGPQHTFQVLTKRPQRMAAYCRTYRNWHDTLPNVWLGTSVENQAAAEERIPHLLNTPAAIRFLSCEPLLGSVNLDVPRGPLEPGKTIYPPWFSQSAIHWVITGGESGRYFRSANPDWYRTLRDQCVRCGIAYFHKQDSGPRSGTGTLLDGVEWKQFPKAVAS